MIQKTVDLITHTHPLSFIDISSIVKINSFVSRTVVQAAVLSTVKSVGLSIFGIGSAADEDFDIHHLEVRECGTLRAIVNRNVFFIFPSYA